MKNSKKASNTLIKKAITAFELMDFSIVENSSKDDSHIHILATKEITLPRGTYKMFLALDSYSTSSNCLSLQYTTPTSRDIRFDFGVGYMDWDASTQKIFITMQNIIECEKRFHLYIDNNECSTLYMLRTCMEDLSAAGWTQSAQDARNARAFVTYVYETDNNRIIANVFANELHNCGVVSVDGDVHIEVRWYDKHSGEETHIDYFNFYQYDFCSTGHDSLVNLISHQFDTFTDDDVDFF